MDKRRIYVATRKGLFTVAKAGGKWTVVDSEFLADPVLITLSDPRNGWLYAALGHGHFGVKLHRSKNSGKTWEECAAPVYPTPPDGVEDRCPNRQIPIPWRTEQVWSLEPGGRDEINNSGEGGRLWCGTVPGGLFRSDDGGDSWHFQRSLWNVPERKEWFGGGLDYPGIHSICVDPRDPARVIVGISCGGVWVTNDAGESWKCQADGMWAAYMPPDRKNEGAIQDPHRVVMCPEDPDCLWSQHHNGVFKSTDGSKSWVEVAGIVPSNFGFAVIVHPSDANTAWLAPAVKDEIRIPVDGKVVISRTRDGGRTFDVLCDGLPQEHAYDIVFRHAMDIDRNGEVIAFGSTTGSIWVSENQGDTWESVSHHLPPIYCVRFGSI